MSAVGRPDLVSPTHSDGHPGVADQSLERDATTQQVIALDPIEQMKGTVLEHLEIESKFLENLISIPVQNIREVASMLRATQRALNQLYFKLEHDSTRQGDINRAFLMSAGSLHDQYIALANRLEAAGRRV